MTLTVHNTLARAKEPFEPLDPEHVRLYVCGPTVYDLAHIGNARPVVVFDVLYRLLKRLYPRVTYVRNITDVDDKINARATETGEPIDRITARTTEAFHADMAALGALPPDVEPRATGHIGEMIEMIERLIADDHAYEADGHVLFHVPSMPDYGRLSRHSREELIAGARVDVAPYKRDPADFVLWKPSADDLPGWPSPWGRGRPGWHIECSAMSRAYLGDAFDIHGGGADLIFPHHENELAQSVCAHGPPFVRYWMHNGYLVVKGDKMSKSLGNVLTVRELLADMPGEAVRLALLQAHYRAPLEFGPDSLAEAKSSLDRLYRALRDAKREEKVELRLVKDKLWWEFTLRKAEGTHESGNVDLADRLAHTSQFDESYKPSEPPPAVMEALLDDLNTPAAIAALHDTATALNRAENADEKAALAGSLCEAGRLLGLLQTDPEAWLHGLGEDTDEIEALVAERIAARQSRDFERADAIRDALAARGVALEDGPDGTAWRRTA